MNIQDEYELAAISNEFKDKKVRTIAVNRIEKQDILHDVAINSKYSDT